MIQIGTEGGLLSAPALLLNTPVGFEQNKRNIVVLECPEKTLFLAPAERADVIVDFSQFAGKTVILYNDSPAPVPAGDPRYDFYTGHLDYSATGGANNQGGAPSTLAGFGPNTRTIMQFRVGAGADSSAPVDDYDRHLLTNLNDPNLGLPTIFAANQDPLIVAPNVYARIPSNYLPLSASAAQQHHRHGRRHRLYRSSYGNLGGRRRHRSCYTGDTRRHRWRRYLHPTGYRRPGYTYPPTVVISGGGGIGAKATANIANAIVPAAEGHPGAF